MENSNKNEIYLQNLENLDINKAITNLIKCLLCEDPIQRLSASETLQNEWLRDEAENINIFYFEKNLKSCISLPDTFISRITSKRLSFDDSPI
jgi:hypothetical protein